MNTATNTAERPAPRIAVAALCLPVLALPWGNSEIPGVGSVLILPVTAIAVVVAGAELLARRRPLLVPARPLAAAVAVLLVEVVATFGAQDTALALRLVVTSVLGLAWAALITAIGHDRWAVGVLTGALLVVGGILCASAIPAAAQLKSAEGADVVNGRLTGSFGQPNELGAFAALVLVLGLAVAVTHRRRPIVIGAGVAALAGAAALLLSLSRGAWIGALAGILVLVLALPRSRPSLAVVFGAAVLVVAGLVIAAPGGGTIDLIGQRAATVAEPAADPQDQRPAIWQEAFRQIRSAPVLGHGPGSFLGSSADAGSGVAAVEPAHAHDLALTTTAESGLIGLASVVILVVVGVLEVVRTRRVRDGRAPPAGSEITVGAAAALATVLGQGLLDFPLRNAVLALLTWLLLGLLCAAARSPRPEDDPVHLVNAAAEG